MPNMNLWRWLIVLSGGGVCVFMVISSDVARDGVDGDFFVVAAQVIPILLLALVVEARTLIRKGEEERARIRGEVETSGIDPADPELTAAMKELEEAGAGWKRMSHDLGSLTMVWAGVGEAVCLVAIATGQTHFAYFTVAMSSIGVIAWWLVDASLAFFLDADTVVDAED